MASIREYLERKSDEELRAILHSYCRDTSDIATDAVLCSCSILAEHDPRLPDPYALFMSLCRMYC